MILKVRLHRLSRGLLYALPPIVSYRWPLPVAIDTLQRHGAGDATVVALAGLLIAHAAAFPGYVYAVATGATAGSVSPRTASWVRGSLVLQGVASALLVVWMLLASRAMRGNVMQGEVAAWVVAPAITLLLSVWVRQSFDRGYALHGDDSAG